MEQEEEFALDITGEEINKAALKGITQAARTRNREQRPIASCPEISPELAQIRNINAIQEESATKAQTIYNGITSLSEISAIWFLTSGAAKSAIALTGSISAAAVFPALAAAYFSAQFISEASQENWRGCVGHLLKFSVVSVSAGAEIVPQWMLQKKSDDDLASYHQEQNAYENYRDGIADTGLKMGNLGVLIAIGFVVIGAFALLRRRHGVNNNVKVNVYD